MVAAIAASKAQFLAQLQVLLWIHRAPQVQRWYVSKSTATRRTVLHFDTARNILSVLPSGSGN